MTEEGARRIQSSVEPESVNAMQETNLDILISRAVDGVACPADWDVLEAAASRDASVWRDLARAQRLDASLTAAVREATAAAQSVGLDAAELRRITGAASTGLPTTAEARRAHERRVDDGMGVRGRAVATWGGWAAAAALVVAFVQRPLPAGLPLGGNPGVPAAVNTAGVPLVDAADALLTAYLDQGKKDGLVIGELPDKVLVETTRRSDGNGYDVVYLRQIMERSRVEDLYKVSTDEMGNPTPVKLGVAIRPGPAM